MASTSLKTDDFHGTLFPVFVTADASLDEINQLIRRSDDFLLQAHMSETADLYIISDVDAPHPSERQAWPLPASFESPFVGKEVFTDLADVFKSKLAKGHGPKGDEDDRFSDFVFGVIDERTVKEGLLLCVSMLQGKPEELRTDIEIAAMVMLGPEVSGNGLTDGLEAEADGKYYERLDEEKRKHYLEGSELDEDEEDDEEEEE